MQSLGQWSRASSILLWQVLIPQANALLIIVLFYLRTDDEVFTDAVMNIQGNDKNR